MVFALIDAATTGVPNLNSSLTTYRRNRDGRGAWKQLLKQHCGESKWEDMVEASRKAIYHSTYTATNPNHTLELYTSKIRDAWNDWIDADDHIETSVPTEKEIVEACLRGIKCTNAEVCAAVAAIRTKDTPLAGNRLLYNFDDAAAYLISTCPVAMKKRDKATNVQISSVNVQSDDTSSGAVWKDVITSNGVKLKKPYGKSGVFLGWLPGPKYRKLTPEQHAERRAFRATDEGRTLTQKELLDRIKRKNQNQLKQNAGKKPKVENPEASIAATTVSAPSNLQEQIQIANMISQLNSLATPPTGSPMLPPPPPSYVSTGSTLTQSHVPYNQAMATAASIQAIMRQTPPNQSTK
jgi:hypothetical protein